MSESRLEPLRTDLHRSMRHRNNCKAAWSAPLPTSMPLACCCRSDLAGRRPSEVSLSSQAGEASHLALQLRGDLETIVAKATQHTPADRYASVTALADDLRRYLRHDPIAAKGGAIAYRVSKFVRRHRWAVIAAGTAAIILLFGVAEINRQRVMAERRFQQLHQLSSRVFDLDTAIQRLPGATEARKALVTLSLEYLEGLSGDAADDVALIQDVVDGYVKVAQIQGVPANLNLGDLAAAEGNLAKAEMLVEQILKRRPHDAAALVQATNIAHDRMIVADSEGRDAEAWVFVTQAVERMERILREPGLAASQVDRTIALYGNVAIACINLHHYDDAVRYANRTLELSRKAGDNNRITVGLSLLANALRVQGELDAALGAIREARTLAAKAPARDPHQEMFLRYPLLLREGLIMGEDRGVSLDRGAEAVVPLRQAFDLAEALAKLDARDFSSRSRVGTSGRELGDILRWTAPHDALAVYDIAIGRLREVPNNIKARRDEALALAGSSYRCARWVASTRLVHASIGRSPFLRRPRIIRPRPCRLRARRPRCCAPRRISCRPRRARCGDSGVRDADRQGAGGAFGHRRRLTKRLQPVETLRGHRAPATIERPGRGRSAIGSRSPRYLDSLGSQAPRSSFVQRQRSRIEQLRAPSPRSCLRPSVAGFASRFRLLG